MEIDRRKAIRYKLSYLVWLCKTNVAQTKEFVISRYLNKSNRLSLINLTNFIVIHYDKSSSGYTFLIKNKLLKILLGNQSRREISVFKPSLLCLKIKHVPCSDWNGYRREKLSKLYEPRKERWRNDNIKEFALQLTILTNWK